MNTPRTARAASARLSTWALLAGLALCGQGALAERGAAVTEPGSSETTPAARLVAHHQREPAARQASETRAQPRLGMHVVVRLAVVDVVSHPDSGELDLAVRSRLLGRPIARKPLAVGVTWRF